MKPHIPERWFQAREVGDGVTLIVEHALSADYRCNIWHVRGRERDLVLDTGLGVRSLRDEMPGLFARPLLCVCSHSHYDHSGGLHEFETRLGHPAEAEVFARPTRANTVIEGWVEAHMFAEAAPFEGFEAETYTIKAAPLTGHLDEGDVVDLGDRAFRVLHLPGHSPGSIALWDEKARTLFSGDVVFDGDLFDTCYHSVPAHYRESMASLKELPVEAVHPGHYASFGRERLLEIADEYLAGKRRWDCPIGVVPEGWSG
jgi:glyoxylase-like metal-dependent hydrolase (beta-lactamase superfamily II)